MTTWSPLPTSAIMTPTHLGPAEHLFSAEEVETAIQRMAVAINEEMEHLTPHRPVVLLCVLTGAVVVVGQLMPHLRFPLVLDCVQVGRYGAETNGGVLQWRMRPKESLAGAVVLLVDDILDEGVTLQALQEYCMVEGATAKPWSISSTPSPMACRPTTFSSRPTVTSFIAVFSGSAAKARSIGVKVVW